MYCSSCGTRVASGLSYCSRCGGEVGAEDRTVPLAPPPIPEFLIWAIVGVSVGGLSLIIGLMAVMKWAGFDLGLIAMFTILSFLLLLGAESVFIWLLLRLRRPAIKPIALTHSREITTKELVDKQVRSLPEPVPSVTEQTTRTLEPVYRDRKAE
jgi:hypothetical protein